MFHVTSKVVSHHFVKNGSSWFPMGYLQKYKYKISAIYIGIIVNTDKNKTKNEPISRS